MRKLSKQQKDIRDRKFKKILDEVLKFAIDEELPLSEVAFGINAALYNYRANEKPIDVTTLSPEALEKHIMVLQDLKRKQTLKTVDAQFLEELELEAKRRLEG